jgi:hypothetical protein
MKTSTAVVIAGIILIGAWYMTSGGSDSSRGDTLKNPTMNFPDGAKPTINGNDTASVSDNSVIKNGVQYVTITARGGYQPRSSTAKAGVPTKIVMKTDGAYDCSTSLVIRSLSFRGLLPSTGETVIDAGTPKVGDTLQGVCGMGMYSFAINFK